MRVYPTTVLPDTPKRAIYLYLQLTVAFSAVVWTFIIWSGHLDMGFGLMIPAIMWCPRLAAFVTYRRLGRELRSFAWCWPKNRYAVAAYCVPLAYASIAYSAVWIGHLEGELGICQPGFGWVWVAGRACMGFAHPVHPHKSTGGMILNLATALREEIGWRGLLVPELAKRMSFTKVGILSGVIWAAWQAPLLLLADYHAGTNRWYALACSTVAVVSGGLFLRGSDLRRIAFGPQLFFTPVTTSSFRACSTI